MFQGRKVLVVGAGLGLAGLVCASCTKAQEASGPGQLGVWKEKIWKITKLRDDELPNCTQFKPQLGVIILPIKIYRDCCISH